MSWYGPESQQSGVVTSAPLRWPSVTGGERGNPIPVSARTHEGPRGGGPGRVELVDVGRRYASLALPLATPAIPARPRPSSVSEAVRELRSGNLILAVVHSPLIIPD